MQRLTSYIGLFLALLLLAGCGNTKGKSAESVPDSPADSKAASPAPSVPKSPSQPAANSGANSEQKPPQRRVIRPPSDAFATTVFFDRADSTLSKKARAIVESQVEWLQNNPKSTIRIEGYADERETRTYAIALAAQRANAVGDFMRSRGIDDSRIRTVSYGKERPSLACSKEKCYAKNRRAVTVLDK